MAAAAIIAAVLIAALTVFQIALALGAPAGAASWGGANPGVLPPRLRVSSAVAGVLVYPPIAVLVLESGGVIDLGWDVSPGWLWVLAGLFMLGTLANAASRSKVERVWAPVSLAVAICCAVIALGS
jgi:cell shape-determining protein MreD